MAVDTANKRTGMLSFAGGDLLVIPEGSITAEDRLQLLDTYGGLGSEPPSGFLPEYAHGSNVILGGSNA
jgi:hypothetical protein